MEPFRHSFGRDRFNQKYAHLGAWTWEEMARALAMEVCGGIGRADIELVEWAIRTMKFIPGGRYLYYVCRPYGVKYYNNCFAMFAEDTREGWADLVHKSTAALMCGGGVGVVYDDIRPENSPLKRTGGVASGPIPLMKLLNEIGRNVQQGGSRRSALWAGLRYNHPDIFKFLTLKNWSDDVQAMKAKDYNFPADLDCTNISAILDDTFFNHPDMELWDQLVYQMVTTGEPGVSINCGTERSRKGRNACCEFITDQDSDMCNLGSLNFSRIESARELVDVIKAAVIFLVMGGIKADVPYRKCRNIRTAAPKIGVGVMGVHEWLLQRGYSYGMVPELGVWMDIYAGYVPAIARNVSNNLGAPVPERTRAIAPTGTISLLAGTTSGIEPVFAVAMKRRFLENGTNWKAEYLIDPTAEYMMNEYDVHPDDIDTAYRLAEEPERRVKFQAEMQQYVDMGISSTVNLPAWGTDYNNEDTLPAFSKMLLEYAPKLRGITTYPDGARSGQTLTEVPYEAAVGRTGVAFEDFSDQQCKSGVCGI